MKIIIVGAGKVGDTLAEQLSGEGDDVTVVDRNYEAVQAVSNEYDVMGIVGSGTDHSVLEEAGVEKADLLIAVTGSDELNMLTCLIAKKAGNCQTIARVRNPEYTRELRYIKEELGLAMVINPEFAAAVEMERILRFPSAIKIETFAKDRVEALKFRVLEGSILNNMTVSEITTKLRCSEVLVCTVERGDEAIIPDGNFVMKERDIISVIASPKKASQFFKKIKVQTNQVRDTIIVGGGKITYYLANILLSMGINVKIIENNRERCEQLSELLPQATIICGDGVDQALLMEEGLLKTDSFVTLTNMDEENILLSLFARNKHSKMKVITKINSIAFDEVINKLDLDSIIYPKYVTAEHIVRFVRAMKNSIGSNVETLHHLGDNVEALEFCIRENASVLNIPLEKLRLKDNLLIGCINRGRKIITPKGQDMLMLGDTVVVITTNKGLNDISDILKD